jgi:hypothetical protein
MVRAPIGYDESEAAPDAPSVSLDEVVPTPAAEPPPTPTPNDDAASLVPSPRPALEGMRTAQVVALRGRRATITLRGRDEAVEAVVAEEVDPEVIADALDNHDAVLVELCPGEAPIIVAALHTRRPTEIKLKASTITIEGRDEVLIRSGQGALRVRADGDVELVGSRIRAASRGLFRLVGRMLRLN